MRLRVCGVPGQRQHVRKRDTRPRRIARRGLPENVDSPSEACATFAINRLLQCPTVSSVIIGARNEEQLRQNLGAVGWALTPEQIKALDDASAVTAPYPYFPYRRQEGFARLNPPAV